MEDDRPQKSDAIVVLGGDDFGNRIMKAARLQQAGYAPYVLVSGPHHLLGPESDETIEYAHRQGYETSIFRPLPSGSDSTRSETAFLGQYFREHGIRKVLLVTSNYHTRRAAKLMRKQNPDIWTVVVPAPDPFFTPNTWWQTRNGQKTFMYEWMKTAATALGV
ncbi:MAG: YdcF family protein [Acidobacteriaceae bacterium]|nr:YdcF family protein [Acidobacteriaceae bacterium]